MPLAPDFENRGDHVDERIGAAVLEDRQDWGLLLARDPVRLADFVLLHDDERLALGKLEAGFLGDWGRRPGDGIERAAPVAVPHDRLDPPLLVGTRKVATLFLQRVE